MKSYSLVQTNAFSKKTKYALLKYICFHFKTPGKGEKFNLAKIFYNMRVRLSPIQIE